MDATDSQKPEKSPGRCKLLWDLDSQVKMKRGLNITLTFTQDLGRIL